MTDLQDGALMLIRGRTMDAMAAFELSERPPHLPLRMQEHPCRAMAYAGRLQRMGLKFVYPGLPGHLHHALLASAGNADYGFGGTLCLDMGTEERASRLMHHLQNATPFGLMAVSRYYETLMSCSGSSTSSEMPPEDRARAPCISAGLVRMSAGYNSTLKRALALMHHQVAGKHSKA